MLKKFTSFCLIAIFMVTCSIAGITLGFASPKQVRGEESEQSDATNHTVTTNVSSIFDVDKTAPEEYKENSDSPEGRKYNDEFMSIVENELILTKSKKGDGSASVHVVDQMSADVEKPESTKFSLSGDYAMSYADSVAFNALGNLGKNRDSYALYIGMRGENLFLTIVDLVNKNVVSEHDFGKAKWLSGSGVPQFDYKNFIDATAGDFDGDGLDEIAVTVLTDKENSVYVFEGDDISKYQVLAITDLVNANKVNLENFIKVDSNKVNRPIVSLAAGDFDADDVEELAVSISTSDHSVSANVSKETITTNVAVVDFALETRRVHTLSVIGSSNNSNSHKLIYSAQIAAGDVDCNGIDEIVVAGYVGEVSEKGNVLQNKYSISKNSIGLALVTLTNDVLANGEVSVQSMNTFIESGFYVADDVWTPLAVETASINGPKTADLVFVSGTIYDFSSVMPIEKYVCQTFASKPQKGSNAYVEKVVAGNFNYDEIGRESFAYSICYKYIGQHKYSYQLGYLHGTYNDNEEKDEYGLNVKFEDNSNAIKGKYWINEEKGYVETTSSKYGTNFILTAADCDDDGLQLKYIGTSYAYSDPEVKAILQAAPYFDELGEAGDFDNGTSYTITTSFSKAKGVEHTIGGEASAFVETQAGAIVAKATTKFTVTAGGSKSWTWEKEHSKTYEDSFTATGNDTVIICRMPIKEYRYQVTNSAEGQKEYYCTTIPLKPVYYQLSIDDYNEFVEVYNKKLDEYNAKGFEKVATSYLNKIDENFLPSNTKGNPQNFYSALPTNGQILSNSAYAFGHNGGSISVSQEEAHSSSKTIGHNFHIGGEVEVHGEVNAIFAKVSLGGTVSIEYSRDRSSTSSKSTAISMSGQVGNANADESTLTNPEMVKMYNFNWQFAKWEREISQDGAKVPVVGYIVSEVTQAGPSPLNVSAKFNYDTNAVDVGWEKSTESSTDTLQGFVVYRQEASGNLVLIGEVGVDEVGFSEPYANLISRANYTYYVSAKYLKSTDTSFSYECRSLSTATVVGGITTDQSSTWKGISSLTEITGSGKYYLTNDITATPVTLTGDVLLDLNGKMIISETVEVLITVPNGATFELCDFTGLGAVVSIIDFDSENDSNPIVENNGTMLISGGWFVTDVCAIVNKGSLTINSCEFFIYEGYAVENVENGNLTLNGGYFTGYGSDNAYGIFHDGNTFTVNGGGFNYLQSGIDVQSGKFITLNSAYVPVKSVLVRVLDENGEATTGEFTNEVGNMSGLMQNTFATVDYESDVVLSKDGCLMVCYHVFEQTGTGLKPTCTTDGYITHVCQTCNAYKIETAKAHGHDYGEWIPEVAATTQTYGIVAHYQCSHCKKYFDQNYEEIFALYIGKTGEQGDKGNGIVSIEKISSDGLVDTYKITYDDGTYTTFTVTNGEKVKYTVTFVDEDGSVISTQNYHLGDKVLEPEPPSKPSDDKYTYSFAGWDSEVVDCDGNKTYKATYTATPIQNASSGCASITTGAGGGFNGNGFIELFVVMGAVGTVLMVKRKRDGNKTAR